MRLCCNCFEELLDKETTCPICNSDITLDDNQAKEFYSLLNDVRTANKLKQSFLKKDPKYKLIFQYINYRENHPKNNNYSKIDILDISSDKNTKESEKEFWDRINKHTINNNHKIDPIPKCPSCGSTNTSKIGTLNRMVSTSLFGLASSKIGKTHKCNNCGTTW